MSRAQNRETGYVTKIMKFNDENNKKNLTSQRITYMYCKNEQRLTF